MKSLFLDIAGWIACADEADPDHKAACGARDNWLEREGLLITSDYVIDETLTLLRLRLGLHAAEEWWHALAASKRVVRESIHEERAERAAQSERLRHLRNILVEATLELEDLQAELHGRPAT